MGKSGGSQLAQLKSALSQAGLSRQSRPNNKKRKRSETSVSDKEKKQAKLQAISQRLNPFDVQVTKLKHDIPGEKVKGVRGRPGVSKQIGLDQRRKTLLIEYNERTRSGGIIDRRFGENDPTMTPEERMLERFTRERQRASKVSFNLEDDDGGDGEGGGLTHYGQSISALDDFDATGITLEDDELEKGQIDGETVGRGHFGGFDDEEEEEDGPERKKSKSEVMAEVIAKSKEHRYERQAQKEQDDNIRHELDQEFADIRSLLFDAPPPDPSATGSNNIPLGLSSRTQPTSTTEKPPQDAPPAQDDEYDQIVREMVFEKRAQPTDRLKTEEEVALEEKEKLEKAERARVRRMNGEPDESSDEDEAKGRKRKRKGEADDLDDDFVDEGEDEGVGFGLGAGLGGVEAVAGMEESDEVSEEGSDEGSGSDEDEDGDEEGLSGSEEESQGDLEDLVASQKTKDRPPTSKNDKGKAKELPFTFSCPGTHEEFLDILEDVDEDQVATVVQRIRVMYHPSLAEGNKAKLAVLTSILVDHILYASSPPSPSFSIITSLAPHLFALTKTYPIESADAFISKLILMQKNLSRGLAKGPALLDSKTFPGTAELTFLRIIGKIWSTSDLSHPVVAPAMLLMGQYLGQCRVRSLGDLASGLFLCTIFLQYQSLSKRIVPEAINFLYNTSLHLAPHSLTRSTLPGAFPAPDFQSDICKPLALKTKRLSHVHPAKPDLLSVLSVVDGSDTQSKVDLLALTFALIGKYATMYRSLDGFVELFEPAAEILEAMKSDKFSETLKKTHRDVLNSLKKMLKFATESRKPLLLQAHKPIAIASYVPKFDAGYVPRKGRDNDPERNADQKLKAMYKKEKKGAMRELRKDNKFLAAERARQQDEKDAGYKSRMARAVGEMHSERYEQKMTERAKAQDKKRMGKK